jgi:hypothetical protein
MCPRFDRLMANNGVVAAPVKAVSRRRQWPMVAEGHLDRAGKTLHSVTEVAVDRSYPK